MTTDITACLQSHPLFSELGPLDPALLDGMKLRQYSRGDTVYRPGIDATHAYLIIDGAIKFEMAASTGQQVFVEIAHAGFLIGELELLSGLDYQSTALANNDSTLLLIPKESLFRLISETPGFALNFSRQLATNFYFFQIIAAERESSGLRSRLANLLLSLGLRFGTREGNQVTIQVSHEQLSDMVNASRQRVNMQLNEWQKAGLIQCGYGEVTLLDSEHFSSQSGLLNGVITEENVTPYQ